MADENKTPTEGRYSGVDEQMLRPFAIRDYDKPMGVATYKAMKDMPERLRKAMPDIEELKKLL